MSTRSDPRLGLQLYTLREAIAADLDATLARVATAGYAGVETLGFPDGEPDRLVRALGAHDLELLGVMVGFVDADQFVRDLDVAAAAGATTVVVPFLPPDLFTDRASVSRAAEQLSRTTAVGAERGISIGYHNHYWEMAPIEGRPALTWLFDEVDPRTFAEVDVYWAQVGGVDPVALLDALGPRVRRLHVKDGPAQDPQQAMTAVGTGNVDIPAVLAAAPMADWHVVELDACDTDMMEAVEESARFLLATR